MRIATFTLLILYSLPAFGVTSENWRKDEELHAYLKSRNTLLSKQLVATENLLAQEGYKQDGEMQVRVLVQETHRFQANITFGAIKNGWVCTANVGIVGSTSSKSDPQLEDYSAEEVSLVDVGCGPH